MSGLAYYCVIDYWFVQYTKAVITDKIARHIAQSLQPVLGTCADLDGVVAEVTDVADTLTTQTGRVLMGTGGGCCWECLDTDLHPREDGTLSLTMSYCSVHILSGWQSSSVNKISYVVCQPQLCCSCLCVCVSEFGADICSRFTFEIN